MRWQSLLQEIRALKLNLARLDPRAGMPVLPPAGAAPAVLDGSPRHLGRPLPPSYRALLAQHDGVPQLYHGASLLGARPLSRGTYVDLARMVIDAPGVGAASSADLVPFGIDATGETIFAWDRARIRSDGEIEVVVWVNEIGERVASFPEFLELVRELLVAEIDDRRKAGAPASCRRAVASVPDLRFAAA